MGGLNILVEAAGAIFTLFAPSPANQIHFKTRIIKGFSPLILSQHFKANLMFFLKSCTNRVWKICQFTQSLLSANINALHLHYISFLFQNQEFF